MVLTPHQATAAVRPHLQWSKGLLSGMDLQRRTLKPCAEVTAPVTIIHWLLQSHPVLEACSADLLVSNLRQELCFCSKMSLLAARVSLVPGSACCSVAPGLLRNLALAAEHY